ncbi:carbohydrate ABC transporter permease [Cohnella sp. LGH]|uniref:Putative aldouronate transport system permease protein n=1 Tax=Cohnella phaseoli TaxID=456490 RepID=A0A3D9JS03_9BACL|nr:MULTISPECIES: carbohydrate ABC transporter permease [Cohnella]QTH40729.1 carbohydrate ABC transporter permease [Cohnella sp. LGH]RED76822.1 putative aldouronate transport system permease protein [Cohnella phaseoli]
MKYAQRPMERAGIWLIYLVLIVLSILCILPMIHVLAVSLSGAAPATAGQVTFWPIDWTWESYRYVFGKAQFIKAMGVSVERVALGVTISMLLTVLAAYPLSKEQSEFRFRTAYAWVFVATILFSGGLVPSYMTIRTFHMIDTIWALVLPGAVAVFNTIVLLNFFRGLPRELEEAAFIDGAGHGIVLFRLFLPMSLPAIATLTLFSIVGHWNSWFDGLILMNSPSNYPLSSYLQTVIIGREMTQLSPHDAVLLSRISEQTLKAAQIFAASLPVLIVYPFLQRFFVKGIVLGSVKG